MAGAFVLHLGPGRRGSDVRWFRFLKLFWRLFGPPEKLRVGEIEEMGLLAVKIAQMYAVRADLLGPEKCRKLQELYEETTPLGWAEFKEVFEREASPALKEDLAALDREPLASASLGQVHAGRLKTGEEVVVKVVRSANAEEFLRDVKALRILAKVALFMYPKLERLADPLGTIGTVERLTLTEIDLRNELRGTKLLREVRDDGRELEHMHRLEFPGLHPEYATSRVIIAERLTAHSVRHHLKAGSFPYEALLDLFKIHGYFLFHRGIFHGDLHPGNVHYENGRFWFIDNANVENVPAEFTQGLLDFLGLLGEGRFADAARRIEGLAVQPLPD
ncbi:MAG: AarF/ABC1/UbiB kinase family protein, partial [Akkermansiaceae bacterium]|nr:AarF/ABC1/UbiB kinase family protein [Akkermansiaceae bacterium]